MAWPTDMVAVGDLITAAQLNGLPTVLAKLSGAGASLDFQNIPAHWTHLIVVAALQTGSGANSDTLKLTLNNDTTAANYLRQRMRASNTTVDATGTLSTGYVDCGEVPGKTTGGFSVNWIVIPNYAIAQPHQVTSFGHACWDKTVAGGQMIFLAGGLWVPGVSAAVTRVTLAPASGSFVANSVAMLYGMGAV